MPAKAKSKKPKVEKTVHQQMKDIEKKERKQNSISQGLAIVALLLNILIPPFGLGSLIAGKIKSGIYQIVLTIVGFISFLTDILAIIGAPMMIVAWVWALITGINIVKESK
ncbi:MAG: hypothetical protein Q8L29_02570 [archaeon]|nr:hypothetical protein [archaeon]